MVVAAIEVKVTETELEHGTLPVNQVCLLTYDLQTLLTHTLSLREGPSSGDPSPITHL